MLSAHFNIWAIAPLRDVFCVDQWAAESQARQAFPQHHKRRTTETNQIITTTMSRFHTQFKKKKEKNIPALTIVKQTKGCTHCTAIRTGVWSVHAHAHLHNAEYKMQQRSNGSLFEGYRQYLFGKCTHTHADTHIADTGTAHTWPSHPRLWLSEARHNVLFP